MPVTYIPIASQTLTSAASSVTFTNIPQTYNHLILRASIRISGALDFLGLTVNSAQYTRRAMAADGTTATSFANVSNFNTAWSGGINGTNTTANTFNNVELMIPNYTSSTNKQLAGDSVMPSNSTTTFRIDDFTSLLIMTTAVTSVTLTNSYVAGSSFHLFGISNT